MRRTFEMKYLDVLLCMNKSKETRQDQKNKEGQNKANEKGRKQENNKKERESEKGKWDRVGRTKGIKKGGKHSKMNKNTPFFSGWNSFFISTKRHTKHKNRKGLGPTEMALLFNISNLCCPLIVVVFSPKVLSFSWFYVFLLIRVCHLSFLSSFFLSL